MVAAGAGAGTTGAGLVSVGVLASGRDPRGSVLGERVDAGDDASRKADGVPETAVEAPDAFFEAGLDGGAGVPFARPASAAAPIGTSLIAMRPSPSGAIADPFSVTCNLSGRPTLIIGPLASAGTS